VHYPRGLPHLGGFSGELISFTPDSIDTVPAPPDEVTRLLRRFSAGDELAAEALIPLIYAELHDIAERQMRHERGDHTLQPTALVNEAFLRLAGNHNADWQNRQHFLSLAAQAMRRILVDHARRRNAQKRGGRQEKLELNDALRVGSDDTDGLDLESLDESLKQLADLDPRQARVVELRFFGGLSVEDTAAVLDISTATVKRDWAFARAWLKRDLTRNR